jgi:hypothetical protein
MGSPTVFPDIDIESDFDDHLLHWGIRTAPSQSPPSDPFPESLTTTVYTTASGAAMNFMGQAGQATPQLNAQMLRQQQENQQKARQQAAAQAADAVANSGNEETILSSPAATTIGKRRGRPAKADIERKQREAVERGDIIPSAPVSQSQQDPRGRFIVKLKY